MKCGDELADIGEYRGLRVSRTQGGHRFWYRFNDPASGKQRALHIGHGVEMSLAEARVEFGRLKSQRRIGHIPELPVNLRRPVYSTPVQPVGVYTVAAMVEDYVAALAKRRSPKATSEAGRVLARCVVAQVGNLAIESLTVEQCLDLAHKELDTGHHAQCGVALRELSGAIEHSMLRGRLPLNHADPAALARKLLARAGNRLSSKPRKRFLTDNELRSLLKWLPTSRFSQNQRLALMLALETGSRTGEAIAAQWQAFDLDRGEWSLPRTKTDAPRVIRLSAITRQWLSELSTIASSAWLFPSSKTKRHLEQKGLSEAMWRMRRDDMLPAIDPWSPHDLRRSVRTGLARLGCPRPVAEAILGHAAGGIVGVYDQHGYEAEAGEWLQRWNDHLAMLRPERVDNPGAIALDNQPLAAATPKGSRDGRARLPAS
jgi:integrase